MEDCQKQGCGRSIAVLTSGGDSQGMNAAIRAVVRMALYAGARVYGIRWGYQGLVDGGDNIEELKWKDVSGIIHLGGTVIGSARCEDFRHYGGRKKAALNMLKRHITNLVVIGGDGSLTGADLFRREWPTILKDLVDEGKITSEEIEPHQHLNIVGMVGSIDNDFCGTDMTLGADSALHRIMEALDSIATTAASHQRAFVMEVMGRHCGYLALVSGLGIGADYILIPEWPPEEGWEEKMCSHLKRSRESGRYLSIVIIAEGAQDISGKTITSSYVKDVISKNLNFDTRVTVLGHVQRGGAPSAFDRVLGCRFGAECVLALLNATPDTPSYVVCLEGNQIVTKNLADCVEKCEMIKKAYAEMDFAKVVSLRSKSFENNLMTFTTLRHITLPTFSEGCQRFNFAVLTVGAPASGMNSTVCSFARSLIYGGHHVWAVTDGFNGFSKDEIRELKWQDVDGWCSLGGSLLSTSRTLPNSCVESVVEMLRKYNIHGILIIGGFEGFLALSQLAELRQQYPELQIPLLLVPATMSNNVPGSQFSLGADTTLNVIVECCDKLRQSSISLSDRVFIVETMGGKCGYLATMAGIAGSADAAYIFEEKFTAADILNDVKHLANKFQMQNIRCGLVLRNEYCNPHYSTDFITRLYEEEGQGVFRVRSNVLGYIQQGDRPSPFDRMMGIKFGVKAAEFFTKTAREHFNMSTGRVHATSNDTACVLGSIRTATVFTPVDSLKDNVDYENRLPREQWWMEIRPLLRIFAKHKCQLYRSQSISH